MGKFIDLSGQRFSRLTVIKEAGRSKWGKALWLCRCDCGKSTVVPSDSPRSGNTRSCGCLHSEQAVKNIEPWHRAHDMDGHTLEKLFAVWRDMMRRCYDPRSSSFANYGGRGISVCLEWHEYQAFRAWAYAEGYREDLMIERRNNEKGYSPENCCWATRKQQNNNRRNTIWIQFNNECMSLMEWAERIGIPYHTLVYRYHKGWPIERLLTEPSNKIK